MKLSKDTANKLHLRFLPRMHINLRGAAYCLIGYIAVMFGVFLLANISAQYSLRGEIKTVLPQASGFSLVNAVDEAAQLQQNSIAIMAAINPIKLDSVMPWPIIDSLTLSELEMAIVSPQSRPWLSWLPIEIEWPYVHSIMQSTPFFEMNGKPLTHQQYHRELTNNTDMLVLKYRLTAHVSWLHLMLSSALLTMLLYCLSRYLPHSQMKEHWTQKLLSSGFEQKQVQAFTEALTLDEQSAFVYQQLASKTALDADVIQILSLRIDIKSLTAEQLAWFIAAFNHLAMDNANGATNVFTVENSLLAANNRVIDSAVRVALHPPTLVFNLDLFSVTLHGLTLQLPKTPLFYYFWYAQRKVNGLGAYVNPPQHKPDFAEGMLLASIMAQHHGHQKAIKDIEEEGLKGKTLDQNRNKIKIELQSVLGYLADDYLFSSCRDTKTARYQYALALDVKQIFLH